MKSRVGQGSFRQQLVDYWHGCSVTHCQTQSLLIASHIRPWRKSDNMQRLDVYNGLLLIPNLDKLFDKGYISFDDNGIIILSDFLPLSEYRLLGVQQGMRLVHIETNHIPYLKFHRENCLL
ncbi:MAG: HNH endonuclease [Muribaculaceae bacterium]|nr:HNH endonuclease [Muribaculaceae bacterium]